MTTVISFDEAKLEQQKLVLIDIAAWVPEPEDPAGKLAPDDGTAGIVHLRGMATRLLQPDGGTVGLSAFPDLSDLVWHRATHTVMIRLVP